MNIEEQESSSAYFQEQFSGQNVELRMAERCVRGKRGKNLTSKETLFGILGILSVKYRIERMEDVFLGFLSDSIIRNCFNSQRNCGTLNSNESD